MGRVYHSTKVQRTVFRKLPVKSRFWLQSDTLASTEPHTKYNTGNKFGGLSNGVVVLGAITPGTQVIRTPSVLLGQTHVNS